jgi:cytochrome c nitrite reductase small subunit
MTNAILQSRGKARNRRSTRLVLLILSAMVGIGAGSGGYTFCYARGWSYLFDDPKVCTNCHIMSEDYDGWQKAGHHTAAKCNDCHLPHQPILKYLAKGQNGWHHSEAFTTQNFHEPIRLKPQSYEVLQENCLRCHRDFVENILGERGVMHDPVDCVRCHAGVGHGPTR